MFVKFKEEFTKHIQPCSGDEVAFVLKSYFAEEVRDEVDNVDEDIEAVWKRMKWLRGLNVDSLRRLMTKKYTALNLAFSASLLPFEDLQIILAPRV